MFPNPHNDLILGDLQIVWHRLLGAPPPAPTAVAHGGAVICPLAILRPLAHQDREREHRRQVPALRRDPEWARAHILTRAESPGHRAWKGRGRDSDRRGKGPTTTGEYGAALGQPASGPEGGRFQRPRFANWLLWSGPHPRPLPRSRTVARSSARRRSCALWRTGIVSGSAAARCALCGAILNGRELTS